MKKRLFQKINKIPFWLLYSIIIFYIIWDMVFTYLSIKNNPGVRESNPLHAFLLDIFGLKYFLFMIPIAIILLYFGIIIGSKLILKGKKGINIKNHLSIIMILAMSPNLFNQFSHVLFDTGFTKSGFKLYYPLAILIIVIYCLWIDYEIKKQKI